MPVITGKQMKEIHRKIARLPREERMDRRHVEHLIDRLIEVELGRTCTLDELMRRLRIRGKITILVP